MEPPRSSQTNCSNTAAGKVFTLNDGGEKVKNIPIDATHTARARDMSLALRVGRFAVRNSHWSRSVGVHRTQGRHLTVSPVNMAKITKNDEGKVVSLADEEELRALVNPVLIDVRGEDEIEKRATAPGAINVVWNRDEGNFYDPSELPQDKDTPIVFN